LILYLKRRIATENRGRCAIGGGAADISAARNHLNHGTNHCTIGQVPDLLKKRPALNGKCYPIAVLSITRMRAGNDISCPSAPVGDAAPAPLISRMPGVTGGANRGTRQQCPAAVQRILPKRSRPRPVVAAATLADRQLGQVTEIGRGLPFGPRLLDHRQFTN
jgi:hypothetical protein